MSQCFFLHKGLSVKLQGRYVDVVRAHNDVEAGKSSIKARSEVDRLHAKIFRECNQMLLSILYENMFSLHDDCWGNRRQPIDDSILAIFPYKYLQC